MISHTGANPHFMILHTNVLVHRTYTECLMYPCQEPASSQKDFKGIIATSINPLSSRIPLAKQLKYIKLLLHLFLLLLLFL